MSLLGIQPTDRRLRETFSQLRRDLRMVADGWRGKRVSEALRRAPRGPTSVSQVAPSRGLATREVVVAARIQETPEAVTLVLEDPSGAPFVFDPGAFFTVLVELDGEELRRAYSASSSPGDRDRLALTCKRVVGGRVSSYLNERVQVGARLRLLGPAGAFVLRADPEQRRRIVLIGGGSGITPLMSMIRTLLEVETDTEMALIYGNRSQGSIIFNERLAQLASAHPGRLHLHHRLEDPPALWRGGVGRLDTLGLSATIEQLPWEPAAVDGWYVCGPEPILVAARELLREELDVPADKLHEERFTAPERRQTAPTRGAVAAPVTIRRRGQPTTEGVTVIVPAGSTLLDAANAAGERLPFSCAVGGCGACRVRVTAGDIVMDEPNCLSVEERAAGYVLTCCGAPQGPCSIEVEE